MLSAKVLTCGVDMLSTKVLKRLKMFVSAKVLTAKCKGRC